MHRLVTDTDWDAHGREAILLLRDLLRFDTSNPPGNESACADFVADHLRSSGLEPQVLTGTPGRGNVVARLAGEGDDAPLLLTAHLDVVPAEGQRWAHPPFAAEIHDGWVWGRGAVDMKNMAAMSLQVVRLLAQSGHRLHRDVIFAGVADEEDGCAHGSGWLVAEHPEAVRAGYVLGEVGGFTMHVSGVPIYPVQVAEKGVAWLRATASGATGHGSMPRPDNAIVRLGAFLDRLGRTRLPVHTSAAVERFVADLAATQPRPARDVLPLLLNPRLSRLVTSRLIRDRGVARLLEAVVRNTATPTTLRAGQRVNVIPSHAEAELDGRIAVGSSEAQLLAELRAIAGAHIDLELVKPSHPPHEAPVDTDLFATIREVVSDHHPGAVAVPNVIPGFTDAQSWAKLGAVCYGFSPVRLDPGGPNFAELFHATDERISVAGFGWGLRMLADVVARFCVA